MAFALRRIEADDSSSPRYLYPTGWRRGLVGLGQAVQIARSTITPTPIALVEGVIDAATLSAQSLPVAGLGGTDLPPGSLDALRRAGVDAAILALDADEAGRHGTVRAADTLLRAGIDVYTADAYDGAKDPDALARRPGGVTRLRDILSAAPRAEVWLAQHVHDAAPATDQGRDAAQSQFVRMASFWPPESRARAAKAAAEMWQLPEPVLSQRIETAAVTAQDGPEPEPPSRSTSALAVEFGNYLAQATRRALTAAAGSMIRAGAPPGETVAVIAAAILRAQPKTERQVAVQQAKSIVRWVLSHPR